MCQQSSLSQGIIVDSVSGHFRNSHLKFSIKWAFIISGVEVVAGEENFGVCF
jgi:hypothetical protein